MRYKSILKHMRLRRVLGAEPLDLYEVICGLVCLFISAMVVTLTYEF